MVPWTVGLVLVAGVAVALGTEGSDRSEPNERLRDPTVATPDEDVLGRVSRRVAPLPPPTTVPLCVAEPGCFAWMLELDGRGDDLHVSVADRVVLLGSPTDLSALRLDDGEPVWAVSLERTRGPGGFVVTDDLVLHLDPDRSLVARGLDDGVLRWQADGLGFTDLWEARTVDDIVLVTGERLSPQDGSGPNPALAGVDAATGQHHWREVGRNAALGTDAAYLVDEAGQVVRFAADGQVLWRTDDLIAVEGVWPAGPLLTAHGGITPSQLLRASDGRRFEGLHGEPVAHDDTTVAVLRFGGTDPLTMQLVTDEVVWSTPLGLSSIDCCCQTVLTTATVEVEDCNGGSVVLDRADGREIARTEATRSDQEERRYGPPIGPYRTEPANPRSARSDVLVRHDATGEVVARLPEQSWPLLWGDRGRWSWDATQGPDGLAIFRSPDWLVALHVPDDDR